MAFGLRLRDNKEAEAAMSFGSVWICASQEH